MPAPAFARGKALIGDGGDVERTCPARAERKLFSRRRAVETRREKLEEIRAAQETALVRMNDSVKGSVQIDRMVNEQKSFH